MIYYIFVLCKIVCLYAKQKGLQQNDLKWVGKWNKLGIFRNNVVLFIMYYQFEVCVAKNWRTKTALTNDDDKCQKNNFSSKCHKVCCCI